MTEIIAACRGSSLAAEGSRSDSTDGAHREQSQMWYADGTEAAVVRVRDALARWGSDAQGVSWKESGGGWDQAERGKVCRDEPLRSRRGHALL